MPNQASTNLPVVDVCVTPLILPLVVCITNGSSVLYAALLLLLLLLLYDVSADES